MAGRPEPLTGDSGPQRSPGTGTVPTDQLRSEFAQDPDMEDLIGLFVGEMPGRISQLRSCWERGALRDVQRLAHQLKGAGGGYGFPSIGGAAGRLEDQLGAALENVGTASVEELRARLEELIGLCARRRPGE